MSGLAATVREYVEHADRLLEAIDAGDLLMAGVFAEELHDDLHGLAHRLDAPDRDPQVLFDAPTRKPERA
jgi:hypothetical protein